MRSSHVSSHCRLGRRAAATAGLSLALLVPAFSAWGTSAANPGGLPPAHGALSASQRPADALPHTGWIDNTAALSPTDVWQVGVADLNGDDSTDGAGLALGEHIQAPGANQTFIRHWDGQTWTTQNSPDPGFRYDELNDVAAAGPDDVWAVGEFVGHGLQSISPLVEHWDGTTWSVVELPGVRRGSLSAVSVISADDVWAVGAEDAEHWDGSSWSQVPMAPAPQGAIGVAISSVSGVAADDVWAVGTVAYRDSTHDRAIAEHWDGTTWSTVATPKTKTTRFADVSALATNSVWAVGFKPILTQGQTATPRIEHWDGTSWSLQHTPTLPGNAPLTSVSADTADDVWAAGTDDGAGSEHSALLHYDGSRWTLVASPNPYASTQLNGVEADAPTDAWAVGGTRYTNGRPISLHWDGTRWRSSN